MNRNICKSEIAFSFLIRILVNKIHFFYICMPSSEDTVVNGGPPVCLEACVMTSRVLAFHWPVTFHFAST